MTRKRQPQKAWGPGSWKEGVASSKAQGWQELRVFKGPESSVRQSRLRSEGQVGPVLAASWGPERNWELIPSAREPPSGKSPGLSLVLPCLACGQHLHSGVQGSLALLLGKTCVFGILETQGLVYLSRLKKTASLIKGSMQRGTDLSGTFTLICKRKERVHFAHPSKSGALQESPALIKKSVLGVTEQQEQRVTPGPRNYLPPDSRSCQGAEGAASSLPGFAGSHGI